MKLLRRLILRPLRRDRLRTALTVLAVALGVAVVVAIDLAGDAATGSFRSSLETLAGKTDLEILANGGIAESWFGKLAALPVNAKFSPVMVGEAEIPGIGSVPLYGMDLLGKDSLLVSRALAGRVKSVRIAGREQAFPGVETGIETIDAPGEFVVLDIAARAAGAGAVRAAGPHRRYRAPGRGPGARGAGHPRGAAAVVSGVAAGHAQRRKPAHAARLPLEPARAQLHFAGGGRVPDLQHHRGERGAAARGNRRAARAGRGQGGGAVAVSGGSAAAGRGGRDCWAWRWGGCWRERRCG